MLVSSLLDKQDLHSHARFIASAIIDIFIFIIE